MQRDSWVHTHGERSPRLGWRSAGPAPFLEGRTVPQVTLSKGRSGPRTPSQHLDAITWSSPGEKPRPALMWERKFCLECSAGSKGASSAILKPTLPEGKNYNCHGNSDLVLVTQRANRRALTQRFPPIHVLESRKEARKGKRKVMGRACRGWLSAFHTYTI